MSIIRSVEETLSDLSIFIQTLEDEQYQNKLEIFSDSSIGQHVRHIIEYFTTLIDGYEKGEVSYDDRKRDIRIEENRKFAFVQIERIMINIQSLNMDKDLNLVANFTADDPDASSKIATTTKRELMYVMEHAIHHMAIIKIGTKSSFPGVSISDHFGMAYSTLRYRKGDVYSNVFTG